MKDKVKGFTLVELLVAMAIIAVLIGLAGFGVNLALRGARNSERESTLADVRVAVTDYLANSNTYPETITYSGGNIVVGTTQVPVEGHVTPAATTTSSQTKYCYGRVANGYVLAVELEGGKYYELGSQDSSSCTTGTTIQ